MPFLTSLLALAIAYQAPPPPNALERFFAGRIEGSGTVRILFRGTSRVRTEGRGRILPDGSFMLEHIVHQEGERDRRRTWHLRRAGPGRYTGTISDARGPVTATVERNRVHVTYRTVENYSVDQWLTFSPDARTATNRTTFSRLGVRVATLEETIRKVE